MVNGNTIKFASAKMPSQLLRRRMKYIKTFISIFMILFLIGCSKNGDSLQRSDEELIFEDGAVAFIVKIESLKETIEGFYLEGTVPKTTFNALCITALEGECTTNLVISRYGGTLNGKFTGVKNEFIGYPEYIELNRDLSSSNLFNVGDYYLVLLKEDNDEYQTVNLYHLEDYTESFEWNKQPNGQSKRIIFAFQDNMEKYQSHIKE